jgi:hypothetical protein
MNNRLLVFLFFLFGFVPIYASDSIHRRQILDFSLFSATIEDSSKAFWISHFNVGNNASKFKNSSGHYIMERPMVPIPSAYISKDDPYRDYDTTGFYKPNSSRMKLVANMPLLTSGTTLSVGYDSGLRSQKLLVNNSFFVGVAKTHEIIKKNYLTFSAGKWFGGKISEKPCYDDYDKAYWCQNLTAWSDYKPNYPKNYNYFDIGYTIKF